MDSFGNFYNFQTYFFNDIFGKLLEISKHIIGKMLKTSKQIFYGYL
jgi:hypothetical protein